MAIGACLINTTYRKFALRVIGSVPELRITDGDFLVMKTTKEWLNADFETVGEVCGLIRISEHRSIYSAASNHGKD
jgi:hypothetical protein